MCFYLPHNFRIQVTTVTHVRQIARSVQLSTESSTGTQIFLTITYNKSVHSSIQLFPDSNHHIFYKFPYKRLPQISCAKPLPTKFRPSFYTDFPTTLCCCRAARWPPSGHGGAFCTSSPSMTPTIRFRGALSSTFHLEIYVDI